MEAWLQASVHWLLLTLALPRVGLSAIFLVSLLSATLLPLGSEPAVFGYLKLSPDMFWPAILVATLGNTTGGAISYAMGLGAEKAYERWRKKHPHAAPSACCPPRGRFLPWERPGGKKHPHAAPRSKTGGRWHDYVSYWLHRMGPAALLFSWLPLVGDPLCAVAGWLRLSFWPCMLYMAIGKFLRYLTMTAALLWLFPETH